MEPSRSSALMRLAMISGLLLALMLAFVPCASAHSQRKSRGMPEAPDGHPGLGTERKARDLARYLRKPPKADRKEIESWAKLTADLQVRWNEYARELRKSGGFSIVAKQAGSPTLEQVFAAWRAAETNLPVALGSDQPNAEQLARLHVDLRFRVRAALHADFEFERRELMTGLSVLNGMNDGYILLRDEAAQEISGRVDIAAARMRSMALDLDALAKISDSGPGAPTIALIEELLDTVRDQDDYMRSSRLLEFEARLTKTTGRLNETLFYERLTNELAKPLRRREALIDDSQRLEKEVLLYMPDTPEGKEAPEHIAELKKSHRYGYAVRFAMEGLEKDPLNGDLAYLAGLSVHFTQGVRESRPWFDRYLAINGIRSHDERSWKSLGRALYASEQYALDVVQDFGREGLRRGKQGR